MQHTVLRISALLQLDPKDSTDRWHGLFLEAGLLSTVPGEPSRGSPQADLRDARERLLQLQALEHQLAHASAKVGGFGNNMPLWAWMSVLVLPLLLLQLTRCGQTAEDKILAVGAGIALAAGVALAGLGWVVALELQARKRRRERIEALRARIDPLRASLGQAAARVLTRSFVARLGNRLVVCTPHGEWLTHAAAAVTRSAGGLGENAAALGALAAELREAAAGIERSVQGLLRDPPDDWSDQGLNAEVDPWLERLEALEVPPDPLCLALLDRWSEGAER